MGRECWVGDASRTSVTNSHLFDQIQKLTRDVIAVPSHQTAADVTEVICEVDT